MLVRQFAPHFVAFTARTAKPSTVELYERLLRTCILPHIGGLDLRSVSTTTLVKLQGAIGGTPVQANRSLMVTMRLLRVARLHGYRTRLVEPPPRYRETPRSRWLTRGEAAALLAKLDSEPSISALALRLLLLTGLRKSELLGLQWDEVDIEARVIRLKDSKTGESVRPLSREAAATLVTIPRVSRFVFPGSGQRGRIVALERTWRRIRRELGLTGATIHGLRHTFASRLVERGVSLYIVGKCLGHRTPAMTQRYAHLAPETLLAAVDGTSSLE